MNGTLLFSIHNFDDIPVRLYRTRAEAMKDKKNWKEAKANPLGSMDITAFIGFKLLDFKKGLPVGMADYFKRKGRKRSA